MKLFEVTGQEVQHLKSYKRRLKLLLMNLAEIIPWEFKEVIDEPGRITYEARDPDDWNAHVIVNYEVYQSRFVPDVRVNYYFPDNTEEMTRKIEEAGIKHGLQTRHRFRRYGWQLYNQGPWGLRD